ncbi:unnamed protein product [Closterium sp. NIES-54]
MYAVTDSTEGDCYRCVPPDPGIKAAALGAGESAAPSTSASAAPGTRESAALGAGESALSGTALTEALHTFTLDSGSLRSFFRDSTTLTPLSRPVAVSLADPSGGPVLAHSSTVLPCPAAPSGLLSGLHLPSFSTNLVSGADLQDLWVDQFTLRGQRVTHCTCSRTGRHLATFTRRPGSSLCTLTTASPPVTASGQVAAFGQVFAAASRSSPASTPCSCHPLSHETLLWHHRLGHLFPASSSRYGLPYPCLWSPQVPPSPSSGACPHLCSLCRGPGARRSSLLRGHERYFLLVIDDYSRYTTVFPLRRKGEVTEVLINWIRGTSRQLSESFGSDLPVLRLHLGRCGEFSSNLLRAFCRAEGIRQTFTLPANPQQNGIAERHIGMVMDVAPEHQINRQPRVSLPETTPTLPWTGKVGDASMFRVWGSRAFVRDTSSNKLSSRAVDPVEPVEVAVDSGTARGAELAGAGPGGAEPGVAESEGAEPGGAEPERAEPGGAEPGGAEYGGAESGGAEPGGAESGGSPGVPSRREPLSPQRLREWYARHCSRAAGATGPTAGGASGARATGGTAGAGVARAAGPGGAGAGGTGAVGGARTRGTGLAGSGGAAGVGDVGAGAVGAGAVATGGAAGAGAARGTGAGGAAGVVAETLELRVLVLGLLPSTGPTPPLLSPPPVQSQSQLKPASSLPGPSSYSGPTRGLTERREPESRPASRESRPASPVSTGRRVLRPRPPHVPGTHSICSDSLRAAIPTVTRFLATAVTDPSFESTAASALVAELVDFAAACRLDYATSLVAESESLCPPSVGGECALGTDVLEDRQEEFECFAATLPHLVSMLLAPEGDPDAPDIPTPRSYVEAIEGPYSSQWQIAMDAEMTSWKSTGTYVDEVPPPGANIGVDFFQTFSPTPKMTTLWVLLHVAAQRDYELHSLDFSTAFLQGSLHEEIWLRPPPGFTGSFPGGTQWSLRRPVYGLCQAPREWHDTLRTTLAALGFAPSTADPSLFLRTDTTLPPFYVLIAMDAEMTSWKSTGTYVDEVPPPGANIGVDFFQTFSPTPKMTTLWVLLHVAAQRDYELHSLDLCTTFLQGSLHEEIWLRPPPGFTGSFPGGTQWSLRRPVYGLCQAPREWHDTLRTTLAALGFAPSTADPSLFLRTDTTLPPFYVLVYVDDLVFATADTEALTHVKSELQKRHTCTDLGELTSYLDLWITRDRAQRTITLIQSHMVQQVLQRFGFTYSLSQSTPLPTRHSLLAPRSDESVEPSGPYLELVGCLMYLMTCTRPHLAYPLSILARYVAPGKHRKEHMDAAKRVLRYLWNTSGMGLVLGGRARVVLTGHADAFWVDDLATQRSSQGYTFSLDSGSVSWLSTRSSSVLSSSCEAEIYAGAMAAHEIR